MGTGRGGMKLLSGVGSVVYFETFSDETLDRYFITKYYNSIMKIARGVKLTTHLHLVPRSRMRGTIPPLPVVLS
jgi:hypothetical protein